MKPVHFEYVLSSSRERVIHAVLHRLHLTPGTPLYEDLFVEGQLLFAAAYADYCTRFTAQDEHQIIMYASQRIRWGLIDYLRRERRHQATVNYGLSPATVGGGGSAHLVTHSLPDGTIETQQLLARVLREASPGERTFLVGRLARDLSIKEIAREAGVAPGTVYRWRRQLRARMMRLRDET